MNFIKNLFGKGEQSKSKDEKQSQYDPLYNFECYGQLIRVKHSQVKEVIIESATANLLDEEGEPFSYSLHIFNSNKNNNNEDECGEKKEFFFPISSDLQYSIIEKSGFIYLSWLLKADNHMLFCMVGEEDLNSKANAVLLHDFLCRCLYENVYKKSHKCAVQESYKQMIQWSIDEGPSLQQQKEEETKYVQEQFSKMSIQKQQQQFQTVQAVQIMEVKEVVPTKESKQKISTMLNLFGQQKDVQLANSGKFYQVDNHGDLHVLEPLVALCVRGMAQPQSQKAFCYQLEIYNAKGQMEYNTAISTHLNYHIDNHENWIKWVEVSLQEIKVFCVKFDAFNVALNLKFVMAKCAFEFSRQQSLDEVVKQQEESVYQKQCFEQEDQCYEQKGMHAEDFSEQCDIVDIEDQFSAYDFADQKGFNKQTCPQRALAQAAVINRTFASKDNEISVFKTSEGDGQSQIQGGFDLEHVCTLPVVKNFQQQDVCPKKLIMYDNDSKMLMLDKEVGTKIYNMDLAKGKIIQEFELDGFNTISDMVMEHKHASSNHDNCFISLNAKNIFKGDLRVDPKHAAVQNKTYAKAPGFTCLTTNDNAHFATASDNGDIRLYKEVGKNALNLYHTWGDSISSLDSMKDGQWLVATCDTYLILLPTFENDLDGYTKKLGKNKPIPRRLTIHPNDIAKYNIREVHFSSAKFDDSSKNKESYIVSATGNFIITWSLKKILAGRLFDYQIKKLDSKVVQNEFRFNHNDNLLLMMPD